MFEIPIAEPTGEEKQAYDELTSTLLANPPGIIDFPLDYPKIRYLDYLVTEHKLLLHGSSNTTLSSTDGTRKSREAGGGFGARPGTYAASDGLWPMWFAMLTRDGEWWKSDLWKPHISNFWNRQLYRLIARGPRRLKLKYRVWAGTSNWVMHTTSESNTPRRFARFAIGGWFHELNAYSSGVVYALNRSGFEKDARSEQWASTEPSDLLFGIRISPTDFPCMNQVAPQTPHQFFTGARRNDLLTALQPTIKEATPYDQTSFTIKFLSSTTTIESVNEIVNYLQSTMGPECNPKAVENGSEPPKIVVTATEPSATALRSIIDLLEQSESHESARS
jgi:hypothetical protein